jgi:hypothetical protein
MMGCQSSSGSGGGSTTPTTSPPPTTQLLVGTWNLVTGRGPSTFTFNANGTESEGSSSISDWSVNSNNVLTFTEPAGNIEAFTLVFSGNNQFSMTSLNSDYSTITYSHAS